LKRILLAVSLCLVLGAAKSPKPAPLECGDVGTMAKRMMTERKLAYLSDAIDSNDRVHMWFINRHTGMWAELEVTDDLRACVVREGYDWHFAVGR